MMSLNNVVPYFYSLPFGLILQRIITRCAVVRFPFYQRAIAVHPKPAIFTVYHFSCSFFSINNILSVLVPLAMWAAEMTVKIAFGARQFVKINRYAFDCSVFLNFFDLHNIRFLIQFHTPLIVRRPHLHNPPQRSVHPNRIYKYRIVLFLQVVFPTFLQTL